MNALEIRNVTKRFGKVVANKDINLTVNSGEILAILGENGSGKTTLMNMISGIYHPDAGEIFVNEKPVVINSPKDAFALGIGMIHQHFKLVDVFTATENIVLGLEKDKTRKTKSNKKSKGSEGRFNAIYKEELGYMSPIKIKNKPVKKVLIALRNTKAFLKASVRLFKEITAPRYLKEASRSVLEICEKYGFEISTQKKIYQMSVSEKQTVEIIKVLYRGADILILDEPTAVLTPQETQKLFAVLRRMRDAGKSIIIITHKLNEVMSLSDKVAVLRKGEYIGTVVTAETTEAELTEMMVGKKISLNIDRSEPHDQSERLVVSGLDLYNKNGIKVLDDISFEARSGEILGIAGIAGSGQRELLETIAGLRHMSGGDIIYNDPNTDKAVSLKDMSPLKIRDLGVRLSFVPEDRLGMGLVGNMDIVDNMMLRSYRKGNSMFLNRKSPKELADTIIKDLDVVTPSAQTPVRKLSGGNVQKVLVGREISASPTVLMAAYPVRGLDINSSYTIYNLLNQQKEGGAAVIFVGEDLDVLIELCDRILVVNSGKITGVLDARNTTKEEIGLLMTKTGGAEYEER